MNHYLKADLSWLEDPEVFRVGRLDAHSDHSFFETETDWAQKKETLRQSLNGTWKFWWSKNPGERPADFYRPDADISNFGEIQVPGHMELQGYDQIHYINTMYPWEGHTYLRPPEINWEYNPVGSYVKEFDLEKGLAGKRVCLSLQGAEQAVYVWLNGVFIGYAEDSFTPSEFDLTGAVREADNRLCIEVYKRSSAAWLEDQDFFRFSGLFRDVFLYAKPKCHVEDLWIKAGVLEDYHTGELEIEARVSGERNGTVTWEMLDERGQTVKAGLLLPDMGEGKEEPISAGEASMTLWRSRKQILENIELWDVGKPYLYRIILRILDENGNLTEIVPYKTGFRRFELRDKRMLLNGKRLEIHGVNRHEWNAYRGRAITEEDMYTDIEILKRNHINAVRTCHYPNQSLWYQLCDEAGICVMDETNLESHGSWQKMGQCEPSWNVPGSKPEWEACVLDRAASMLERDKNHACILWWSCGNESYAGECIRSMSRYFHEKDPSRLVHYEGVFWNRSFDDISDVESRMYAPPGDIRKYLENNPQKPFLLCEYMHDMGNSLGGMESYMKLGEEFPMFQGGFIWDFIDQALWHQNQYGEWMLGYGGDFGDRPTDYAFSGNGIVFADRTEKPAMQEVRFWYNSKDAQKRHTEKNERLLEKAVRRLQKEEHVAGGCLQVTHGDVVLGVKGNGMEVLFSFQEGGPVSLKYQGKECLYRVPKPAFWRAATENDKGNGFAAKSAAWLAADLYSTCVHCRVTEFENGKETVLNPGEFNKREKASNIIDKVQVVYVYQTGTVPNTEAEICYTVDRTGRMKVTMHYKGKEDLPEPAMFGIRFCMPQYYETVVWEGLSGETYPDRMKGGEFGIHEGRVTTAPYLVPQECGNHMQTCQMQTGPMRIVMDQEPFAFSALPYTPEEIENAMHQEELPRPYRTVITVAAHMRGVGGIDSWGADVEPAYHVSAEKDMELSFYICEPQNI